MQEQRIIKRYSEAIKHKAVREIETGKMSVSRAAKLYEIGGVELPRFGGSTRAYKILVLPSIKRKETEDC